MLNGSSAFQKAEMLLSAANMKEENMATIMPKGERVRQAVRWISGERMEDEKKPIKKLVQEAAMRFNLSPKEELELSHFYKEKA